MQQCAESGLQQVMRDKKGKKKNQQKPEEEGEVDGLMLIKWGRLAGYLSLLGDIQKVVPCSDADKPVGSCGAWRGVCYKQRETSVYTLLHTHMHTELIAEFDGRVIIID